MMRLNPWSLDFPTLVALAGVAANEHLLSRLHSAGYHGIRTSHGYVIQLLVEATPTVGELAEQLAVSQQAVSKSVSELEALDVVQRHRDSSDNRVRRVALTQRGHSLLRDARKLRAELEDAVALDAGDLTGAKRAVLALLERSGGWEAVSSRRAQPPTA